MYGHTKEPQKVYPDSLANRLYPEIMKRASVFKMIENAEECDDESTHEIIKATEIKRTVVPFSFFPGTMIM